MDKMNMHQEWNTRMAVHQLSPEIRATSARIRQKKEERQQLTAFIAVALGLVGLIAYVAIDYQTHNQLTKNAKLILGALGVGAGLATAFAPILAYFAEEDLNHESY